MSGLIECQQNLLALASDKGYLTFDDIMDAASTSLLSLSEIDHLSDNLQSLGVLLYETEPERQEDDSDTYSDYSRTDYGAIFNEIAFLSDAVLPLIKLVKEILPPQFGEVQSLVEQLQYDNKYARERLVLSHLRIALRIALSISKQYSYNIEDAVSASIIGLIEAVEHFDPNGFSAFQSYSSMWIQQNIHRYCNPIWMQYYYPVHIKEKLYPALLHYNDNNGTSINDDCFDFGTICELAEKYDFDPVNLWHLLNSVYSQVYNRLDLDDVLSDEKTFEMSHDLGFNPDHLLSDDDTLIDHVAKKEIKKTVSKILDSFTPREQAILRLRFGFYGSPKTLEEVGQVFGITKERVRQIETKCIRRLRHPTKAKMLKDFYR